MSIDDLDYSMLSDEVSKEVCIAGVRSIEIVYRINKIVSMIFITLQNYLLQIIFTKAISSFYFESFHSKKQSWLNIL